MHKEDEDLKPYASSPCYMHEVDPAYMGLPTPLDPPHNVAQWRKDERQRLIAGRRAISVKIRRRYDSKIIQQLEEVMGDVAGRVVSAYWPFRGEPDLRDFLKGVIARGGHAALPVVVARGTPLIFRIWTPGAPLEHGIWNIPVPTEVAEVVDPDVVISPVVGFDSQCYRLGYGGGFFDRTLAAQHDLGKSPQVIGVGYQQTMIPTIHPQPHDIAMHFVITESGITKP